MDAHPTNETLPAPPSSISFDDIHLHFSRIELGDSSKGLVPWYHFRILIADGTDVGHINFRVGFTNHVRVCAGHIGFEVAIPYRGRGYAFQACQAIAPFVRTVSGVVTITCDPDNAASRRTIERLGAIFIDEVPVPSHDPHSLNGSPTKRRYRWTP